MRYELEIDGLSCQVHGESLAEAAAICREWPTKQRARIWNAESGLLLVDTKFGDIYDIVTTVRI